MFGLALQLGCTVAELESRMSAREFMQWLAWFEIRNTKPSPERDAAAQWFQLEE